MISDLFMEAKISVIIPVYNAGLYLERCVQSLFSQSLEDIEYIFVDDCSTDESMQILKNMLERYPDKQNKVKVIRHAKNRGSATARNTGLKNATGEYIGWVDADDYVEVTMFEKLYEEAIKKDSDLVWCGFYKVFPNSTVEVKQNTIQNNKEFIRDLISGKIQGMLWNKIMKRKLVEENGISFSEGNDLGEDRAFLIKFLFYSSAIHYVDRLLYFYTHTNEISITRDPNVLRIYEEINNAEEIDLFLTMNEVDFIMKYDFDKFKFNSKSRLLYTASVEAIKNWAKIFPETNYLIRESSLLYKHKILAHCSLRESCVVIKMWCFIKNLFKRAVNKK